MTRFPPYRPLLARFNGLGWVEKKEVKLVVTVLVVVVAAGRKEDNREIEEVVEVVNDTLEPNAAARRTQVNIGGGFLDWGC